MALFENYGEELLGIEREIIRHGVALGIDWNDPVAVDRLAHEAIAYRQNTTNLDGNRAEDRAKLEIFGLAQLMLNVMAESAGEGVEMHGGAVWKALGRALWRASAEQAPAGTDKDIT